MVSFSLQFKFCPRPAVEGSGQPAGLSGSLGRAAAAACGLQTRAAAAHRSTWTRWWRRTRSSSRDAGATPVRLHGVRDYGPTACWTTSSSGRPSPSWPSSEQNHQMAALPQETLKTTPAGLPSRRCTSMASSWGAVTFSCRCTRTGTWWKNWKSWGSALPS